MITIADAAPERQAAAEAEADAAAAHLRAEEAPPGSARVTGTPGLLARSGMGAPRARSVDVWRLAEQYFPDEAAAAAAPPLPLSPPMDASMNRLHRQMDVLDSCCSEPRVRPAPSRAWLAAPAVVHATPGLARRSIGLSPPSHTGARALPHRQASPLLGQDLVEEAEQMLQRSVLRQRKDAQLREARLAELEAQRDVALQEGRELREQLLRRDLQAKAQTEEIEELKDLLRRQSAQLKSLEEDMAHSSSQVQAMRLDQQHELQVREQEILALKNLARALSQQYNTCSRELATALQLNEQLQHAVSRGDEESRELVHQLNVLRARCSAVESGVETKVKMLQQHYEGKVAAREEQMLAALAQYEDAFMSIRAQAPRVYTSSSWDTSYPPARDNTYIEAMISSLSPQPVESGLGGRHRGEGKGAAGQGGRRRGGALERDKEGGGSGGSLETSPSAKRIHLVHSLVGGGQDGGADRKGTTVGGLLPVPLASKVEISASSDDGD